jgi:glycogen debranching enzyme
VAGEHGAIFGQQNGECEAWAFPVKVLSHLRITAELKDYPVPIDVNDLPGAIEVTPGRTTIVYSHAAFTIRQHMFAPRGAVGASPVILFEFASVRPMKLTFSFTPVVERMWPAPNFGRPSAEWVKQGNTGYYILHTDSPGLAAAVAIPRAQPGILQPYQERPKFYPLQFQLNFDPAHDAGLFFPLLMEAGNEHDDFAKKLAALDNGVPALYASAQEHYRHLLARSLQVESPDQVLNEAIQWSIVSIDQMQVKYGNETGMVAGYYSSGDSARPGFGWFFGRDTMWTLYAVNSYGDFALTRKALDFLFTRQRADGKMMHEFSQTAGLVDWKSLPYWYASADATPLAIMAMDDYVSVSGDVAYLKSHWDSIEKAYTFLRAHDSDRDGIYENTEGTGWVESWIPRMPHQEIYLAALDQQATESMSRLAALLGNRQLSSTAAETAGKIRSKLASEYYDVDNHFYAFSRNADGTLDTRATIFPAVSWWTGRLTLPNAGPMLSRWASDEFSTGWGTRDLGKNEDIYDPISYHQGSVWPLFTGWVSLAEFRTGHTLSGTAHLMQNAGMTFTQDLGAVTELLSGAFFQPLGRSSSHQLWSSAMVLTPAIRGLLGIEADAQNKTLRLDPHLPASWDKVSVQQVPLGDLRLTVEMVRSRDHLVITATTSVQAVFCLARQSAEPTDCEHAPRTREQLSIPLPGAEVELPNRLPTPGSQTSQIKALDETVAANSLTLTLEAPGGSTHVLRLRRNKQIAAIDGATATADTLTVRFPPGTGYTRQTVRLLWKRSGRMFKP